MLADGLSADQVRNASGTSFAEAQAASYMAFGAAAGWSLADLCAKTGMAAQKARSEAFRWGIQFTDYDPFAKPARLEFRKVKSGWDLLYGDEVIGECRRAPDKRYEARTFSQTSFTNWDARRAMRDLAVELDAQSIDLHGFGGAPVTVLLTNKQGLVEEVLFPVEDEAVRRCRDALQFRTIRKLGLG